MVIKRTVKNSVIPHVLILCVLKIGSVDIRVDRSNVLHGQEGALSENKSLTLSENNQTTFLHQQIQNKNRTSMKKTKVEYSSKVRICPMFFNSNKFQNPVFIKIITLLPQINVYCMCLLISSQLLDGNLHNWLSWILGLLNLHNLMS